MNRDVKPVDVFVLLSKQPLQHKCIALDLECRIIFQIKVLVFLRIILGNKNLPRVDSFGMPNHIKFLVSVFVNLANFHYSFLSLAFVKLGTIT